MINKAVAIDHHGNDVEKFIQMLAIKDGAPGNPEIMQSSEFKVKCYDAAFFVWEQA